MMTPQQASASTRPSIRRSRLALVALLALAVLLGAQTDATAAGCECPATDLCFCGANSQCFWSNTASNKPAGSFTGWGAGYADADYTAHGSVPANEYTHPYAGKPTLMNDTITYVFNNTSSYLMLFEHDHYDGGCLALEPRQKVNLATTNEWCKIGTVTCDPLCFLKYDDDPKPAGAFNNKFSSSKQGQIEDVRDAECRRPCGEQWVVSHP